MATILFAAMFLTWKRDARNHANWFGHTYNDSSILLISIIEPLSEKANSYKSTVDVVGVIRNNSMTKATGKVIVYFAKNERSGALQYGNKLLIRQPATAIKNSGNPGAFNYERYAAFQQVFHTVYLKENKWTLLPGHKANIIQAGIFTIRDKVVELLREHISSEKNVLGIAEALLIGFKEDLDRDLVQAYSNAGVVHIIAISGLHLGLIYVIITWMLHAIPWIRRRKTTCAIITIVLLWIFALVTGASPSVLRSASMFTCVIVGKMADRKTHVYQSLAASASIMLCINPYLLWDVGFQLSYSAVAGIVILQQPIQRSIFFKNSFIQKAWQLMSVTLAAQITTFPICLYYFHQFPVLFFFTNMVVVPLATIILCAEIALLAISWIPVVAGMAGKIVSMIISGMNRFIIMVNHWPYSLIDEIYADLYISLALSIFVFSGCAWFLEKRKMYVYMALTGMLCLAIRHAYVNLQTLQQKKIIIYQVPKMQAMDFINGQSYKFIGDSILQQNGYRKNFHLKPARISIKAIHEKNELKGLNHAGHHIRFHQTNMLIVDQPFTVDHGTEKPSIDIICISRNPTISMKEIQDALRPSIIVFDPSNSLWKIAKWKKDCEALHLPCFSIPEQGAFIYTVH